MDFKEFSAFINQEREKFRRTLVEQAKKIELGNVIAALDAHGLDYDCLRDTFEEGQPLHALICQGWYDVQISPKELIIETCDIEIARFSGKAVEDYYKRLATDIVQEKERHLSNLPF